MTPIRLLAAAAFMTVLAGPALAQDDPNTMPDDANTVPPATAPAAEENATPASAMSPVILRQDSVTPEQAATLKPGDANVVTNGPVPDTRENRRKYGGPVSNGGRQTTPAGN